MQVEGQRLAHSLQTNLTTCIFSPRGAYLEGGVKKNSSVREPQSHPHYRFAMRIGSLTDCAWTHAALAGVCDCHMIRRKKMDLHFLVVLVALCYSQLSLCNASKKQAKERALVMEEATDIYFEEATGVQTEKAYESLQQTQVSTRLFTFTQHCCHVQL